MHRRSTPCAGPGARARGRIHLPTEHGRPSSVSPRRPRALGRRRLRLGTGSGGIPFPLTRSESTSFRRQRHLRIARERARSYRSPSRPRRGGRRTVHVAGTAVARDRCRLRRRDRRDTTSARHFGPTPRRSPTGRDPTWCGGRFVPGQLSAPVATFTGQVVFLARRAPSTPTARGRACVRCPSRIRLPAATSWCRRAFGSGSPFPSRSP